jgi:probable F420-dependent oxidoreductase
MQPKRYSLSFPLMGFTLPEYVEIAREAEAVGYSDVWSSEVDGLDCFSPLAVIGEATRLRLGTAIANVYTRGPATLAMSAATLAELAPGRFCLGIGAGSSAIVETWNGGQFHRPLVRVREMLQFLRAALAGERIVFRGETFTVNGFRLSRPPSQAVPIHIGALRPAMLRLAGTLADGAILNWLSAEDVHKSAAVVRGAAQHAGRDPQDVELTARLFLFPGPVTPAAELGMRRHITAYLNVPVYKAFQQWMGRTDLLAPMWEAWEKGDRKAAVAAVPEQVIKDLLIYGSVKEMRAHVRRYLDAGINTAFLQFSTFETSPARQREIVRDAMRALGPGLSPAQRGERNA